MDFKNIVQLLGGLGVFLYGMKLMSESLQNAAGDQLKLLLRKMTKNRVTGLLSGVGITMTVQSSSVTTVMLIGFVNAGLLTLVESLSVIMGANIGTTVTAWMVSLLGFKVKVTAFALPAIAIGVVGIFINKRGIKHWGSVLVGFGILFLGLDYLKGSIPSGAKSADSFAWLSNYANYGYLSILIFVGIGTFLTIVIQSSSATSTITMTLAFKGIIPIDAAMAMILGENIGTTITANLAALAGNINAKKAALSHTVFNLIGVAWALLFFFQLKSFVFFITGDSYQANLALIFKKKELLAIGVDQKFLSEMYDHALSMTRFQISIFHTTFNVLNTFFLIWFIPQIASFVEKIMSTFSKAKSPKKDSLERLKILSIGGVDSTEFELEQLQQSNQKIIKNAIKSYRNVRSLILDKKYDGKKVKSVLDKENELDSYRHYMLQELNGLLEKGATGNTAHEIMLTMDRVKYLEEIGDFLAKIVRKIRSTEKEKITLGDAEVTLLKEQLSRIDQQYKLFKKSLLGLDGEDNIKEHQEARKEVENFYRGLEPKTAAGSGSKKKKRKDWLSYIIFRDIARYLDNVSYDFYEMIAAEQKYIYKEDE